MGQEEQDKIQEIEDKLEAGEQVSPEETSEYIDYVNTKVKGIRLADDIKLLFKEDRHQEAIDLLRHTIPTLASPSEVSIAADVRDFVDNAVGVFRLDEIYRWIPYILGRSDKQNVSNTLGRLVNEGVIERIRHRNGVFRKRDYELEEFNWKEAKGNPLDLVFPLGIHQIFATYPKNILVFAGTPDSGKTAFFLNFVKENMEFNKITYFNSEMSEQEFRKRCSMFDDIKIDDWQMQVRERSCNFADVLEPDEINIIDYMELGDEIYKVGKSLREIHDALGKGIALIGLQKPMNRDLGYGKELALQIPRFYMSMDFHMAHKISTATIMKCKNRITEENMVGKLLYYKLYGSHDFQEQGVWHYKYDDPYDSTVFPKTQRRYS